MKRFTSLLVILFATLGISAQHTIPTKDTLGICSTCIAPNTGKKTAPYIAPLRFVGRYVDSANTRNVQNIGMRTVRAQRVRVAGGRIYVEYAEAVAEWPIARFLAEVQKPLSGVGVMNTGKSASRYGDPVERVAKPGTFWYAEARASGWTTGPEDTQVVLTDFDADNLGNVITGTLFWGWGVSRAGNDFPDTRPMSFLSQVKNSLITANSVISIPPYAIISAPVNSSKATSLLVYDIGNPEVPSLKAGRTGKENGIIVWAKFDEGRRVATVNADGQLRIYTYETIVTGAAPLATFAPITRRTFRDLSFDESGTLWAVESSKSPAPGNRLWQITPTARSYTTKHHVLPGTLAPEKVSARKGYAVVAGYGAGNRVDVRLYRTTGTALQSVNTGDFFYRFYHDKTPPAGFASASTYSPATTALEAVHLLDFEGKLYLLYSAAGLGDVYEIESGGTTVVVTPPPKPPCPCNCTPDPACPAS